VERQPSISGSIECWKIEKHLQSRAISARGRRKLPDSSPPVSSPGSGVDLQLDRGGVVELYAIQSAPNTKSAGGRRSDVDALRRAAGAIRASKRRVELYIAVLSGRRVTRPLKSDPNILVLASDEFWERVSGIVDFRARLIRTTAILSSLVVTRAASEVARIRAEAHEIFGDAGGSLDLAKLADPPARVRTVGVKRNARSA
jgi:hypothetical protein